MRRETTWQVHRPQTEPDGSGGQHVTMAIVAIERGDVRELVGSELMEARQAGAEHTHSGKFRLRANIRRNDELRSDTQALHVLSTSESFPPFRLLVTARSVKAGA